MTREEFDQLSEEEKTQFLEMREREIAAIKADLGQRDADREDRDKTKWVPKAREQFMALLASAGISRDGAAEIAKALGGIANFVSVDEFGRHLMRDNAGVERPLADVIFENHVVKNFMKFGGDRVLTSANARLQNEIAELQPQVDAAQKAAHRARGDAGAVARFSLLKKKLDGLKAQLKDATAPPEKKQGIVPPHLLAKRQELQKEKSRLMDIYQKSQGRNQYVLIDISKVVKSIQTLDREIESHK